MLSIARHKTSTSRPSCAPKNTAPSACRITARPTGWSKPSNSTCRSHPTATTVRAKLKLKPNSAGAPAPLVLDGDELKLVSLTLDGKPLPAESFRRHARQAHHRAAAEPAVRARDRDRRRSDRQHPAHGPLPRRRDLLHAMRGRGLSPHHLFPRPARRDGGLHHAHRSRQNRGAGAARQRQSRPRTATCRAPTRHFAVWHDPFPKPSLSVRAGRRRSRARRGQLHHHVRPQGRAAHLCRARQGGPLRLRHGQPQARHALGRGGVRPRIRSRYFHDRRRVRLQHGRDGEQGPQRLQRQIRAGLAGDRDRRRLRQHRGGDRARIFPQLDRQPHHLPRLVPALPEGRA